MRRTGTSVLEPEYGIVDDMRGQALFDIWCQPTYHRDCRGPKTVVLKCEQ